MKAGRVRCGTCNVVLHDARARRGKDRGERVTAKELLNRDPSQPWGHDEIEAVLRLNTNRGRALAQTGSVEYRGAVVWKLLVCRRCSIRYALPLDEFQARWVAALKRGEDAWLTAADRDRSPGVS